jgi:hypothetical protein
MSESGPRLPTLAVQQVGSYLGYTGRDADILGEAALDPKRTSDACPITLPSADHWWYLRCPKSPAGERW